MPILYSVISRGTTVLAKYAECVGNFAEVTEQIMSKISPDNHKLTYLHGNYLIHYITEDKIVYMCITDDEFERSRAFLYLQEIKKRFLTNYGLTVATAIAYSMNTEFSKVLSFEMRKFSEEKNTDKISRVHGQIDELRDIMVKNIENVTAREERLEILINKTENLRNTTVTFRKSSRNLAREMFWKNIKMYVIIVLIIIFVVYVIISMACGGLLWQQCIHPK